MKIPQILENLQGVKKFHRMDWSRFVDFLAQQDIHIIGRGSFGRVFYSPSWNYVIKVFEKDDAYLKFVNFAINNPNKHFPKFLKNPKNIPQFLTRKLHAPDYLVVVKIEKLEEIEEKLGKFLAKQLDVLELYYFDGEHFTMKDYFNNEYVDYDNVQHLFKYYQQKYQLDVESILKAYISLQKQLNHTITDDLHEGNLMQREDGTVVFIDPFYIKGHDDTSSTIFQTLADYEMNDRDITTSGPHRNAHSK